MFTFRIAHPLLPPSYPKLRPTFTYITALLSFFSSFPALPKELQKPTHHHHYYCELRLQTEGKKSTRIILRTTGLQHTHTSLALSPHTHKSAPETSESVNHLQTPHSQTKHVTTLPAISGQPINPQQHTPQNTNTSSSNGQRLLLPHLHRLPPHSSTRLLVPNPARPAAPRQAARRNAQHHGPSLSLLLAPVDNRAAELPRYQGVDVLSEGTSATRRAMLTWYD